MALFTLFPVVLVISTTFKTSEDVRLNPFGLFTSFSLENLDAAWNVGRFSDYLVEQHPAVGAEHAGRGRRVDHGRATRSRGCRSRDGP